MPKHSADGSLDFPQREFHVSRNTRDRYAFEDIFFALNGNVIFANFHAARRFAQRMNERRDLINHPELAVHASELNAMGLVDEILHYVIAEYRQARNPNVLEDALSSVEDALGEEAVSEALETFVREFPPLPVYRGAMTPQDYLEDETGGVSNRALALEEMLLLWIANDNPAAAPFMELFDDEDLESTTVYSDVIEQLESFFEDQPPFGPDNQNLFEMLRSPSQVSPGSWQGQLEFIRTRWFVFLGTYVHRLLSSVDFLEEEARPFFGLGPGPALVLEFEGLEVEPEAFSPDLDWMPRVVMIAKNVYVWLHQLSEHYGREITRLDQIPDEELDLLRRRGFTALWLIGLWERSPASKRIKQIMGNPEAEASAYSLKTYTIAEDLGGEAAFESLKSRSWRRGIRMASDMVPNHMGIDSEWVINHPDWFVSLNYSPYPAYTYNGPDLCDDERVGVYLEDHYYDHSDAAVTFKRVDHWTGDTRYIYHGNDGTQMPWNDTAQLDYLNPEVREAVIQTILAVAQRSPIIRFDAAMTLAKRHYQRLWFPEPGTGGAIASRAEFGLTKAQFDDAMPNEFWREVVNRVAEEAPDTLLLAEAFWMMEGYFVRTLGMHRVYNSAFMNMLRDEKNAEYREVMKNTLEFDPEILRRYVNFMNNPDERTAVDQFGKGDKYFGVCTMMITMPGLPMFGHGQIEGYAEKYGMEFRRPQWEEVPDQALVTRHKRQIFPLHHKRYLFAGVDHFYLYDFNHVDGGVDENVFAYSNQSEGERALVLYHNRYGDTRGWIHTSVAYAVKDAEGDKALVQTSLAEGLGITDDPERFLIFRDVINDMEYIRNCHDLVERGLYAELYAYQAHVFVDFREVVDDTAHQYAEINAHLNGRGVPNLDEAIRALRLEPLHQPVRMLVSAPAFHWLLEQRTEDDLEAVDDAVLAEIEQKMLDVFQGVELIVPSTVTASSAVQEEMTAEVCRRLALLLSMPASLQGAAGAVDEGACDEKTTYTDVLDFALQAWDDDDVSMWGTLFGWLFFHDLACLVDVDLEAELSRSWFSEWMLDKLLSQALYDLDVEAADVQQAVAATKVLITYPLWMPAPLEGTLSAYEFLQQALRHEDVRNFIGVNRYRDAVWYHKESFERWLWWTLILTMIEAATDTERDLMTTTVALYHVIQQLLHAATLSEYQVDKLIDAARSE